MPIRRHSRRSALEGEFEWQLKVSGLAYVREFKFHPNRRWRADFHLSGWKISKPGILVEIEGGNFSRGRHVRPLGFENDVEKYNEATILDYKILRGTARHVRNGQLLEWVKEALK